MTANGNGAANQGYFFEDLAVGMEASYAKKITNEDVLAFAELSGDKNPVHLDDAYAAGTMFKQRIAHGFLDGEPVLHGARHQAAGTRLHLPFAEPQVPRAGDDRRRGGGDGQDHQPRSRKGPRRARHPSRGQRQKCAGRRGADDGAPPRSALITTNGCLNGWKNVPAHASGAVLAIGNFDGVHRGHQAVLGRAVDLAKAEGKRSGAVVFEPHPREYFAPDEPFFRLTPLPVKLELLAALGLDQTFVIDFGPELSSLSAEAFAARSWSRKALARPTSWSATTSLTAKAAPARPQSSSARREARLQSRYRGAGGAMMACVFSSSQVRDYLRKGELEKRPSSSAIGGGCGARRARRWPWARTSAFPPPICRSRPVRTLPMASMPSGSSMAGSAIEARVMSARARPSATGQPVIEVYLINFEGISTARMIEVEFMAHLRDDATFANAESSPRRCVRTPKAQALLAVVEMTTPSRIFRSGALLEQQESAAAPGL